MTPMMVDRLQGTDDHLFMHFHAPAQIWLGGQLQDCPAHTLVLWTPGQRHQFGHRLRPWSHSWLHCSGTLVAESLTATCIPSDRAIALPDDYLVERWLTPILDELLRPARPDGIVLESLLAIWIREIHRAVRGPDARDRLPGRLRTVLHLLESNLGRPWTTGELANAARLTPSRFSAEFRRHLGDAPKRYLLRLRMERALHELRDRELSIAGVAYRLGFSDPFYFTRRFTRHHGESPAAYRARLDNR